MRFLTKNTSRQLTSLIPLSKNQTNMVTGGTLGGKTDDPRVKEASSTAATEWTLPTESK